jgi:YspA, cpYpsA-related SLOG family
MMVVLACGGRAFGEQAYYKSDKQVESEVKFVRQALDKLDQRFEFSRVIHGACGTWLDDEVYQLSGADRHADEWATLNCIDVVRCFADWKQYKRQAGPVRNLHMMKTYQPECVIAFPGGSGTANMVRIALRHSVRVIRAVPPWIKENQKLM